MSSERLQLLRPLPSSRLCPCGQPIQWSHLEYLGRGGSVAVYRCRGCGLGYRGREGQPNRARPPRRGGKPLPAEGSPDNPVLDPTTAARLQELLQGGGEGEA